MKIYKITTFLFVAMLAISCNSSTTNQHKEIAIDLNNGEKWKVNTEMTPHILEAEQILLHYTDGDYEQLAEQLETKNKGLIKSCTMNGKSHDELHKWLHPHMQLIEALDDAENKEEADKTIAELIKSFQTYHTYFQ